MKRWWIVILLVLSVGLNLGLLAQRSRAERREARKAAARLEAARLELPPTAAPPAATPPTAAPPATNPQPAANPQPVAATPPQPAAAPPAAARERPPAERLPAEDRPAERPPYFDPPAEDQARGPRDPRGRPPFLARLVERIANDVGVEGEQRRQFIAIQEDFFDRTFVTRENLRRRQNALRENLMSPQPDRALAERQLEELTASQKEIEAAFIDNFFQSTAILDEEQQHRYRRVIIELRRMRWERQNRQGEMPPGGFGQMRRQRREMLEGVPPEEGGPPRRRPGGG